MDNTDPPVRKVNQQNIDAPAAENRPPKILSRFSLHRLHHPAIWIVGKNQAVAGGGMVVPVQLFGFIQVTRGIIAAPKPFPGTLQRFQTKNTLCVDCFDGRSPHKIEISGLLYHLNGLRATVNGPEGGRNQMTENRLSWSCYKSGIKRLGGHQYEKKLHPDA